MSILRPWCPQTFEPPHLWVYPPPPPPPPLVPPPPPPPPTAVDQLISPPGYGSQVADKCIDTAFTLTFCKQAYRSLY